MQPQRVPSYMNPPGVYSQPPMPIPMATPVITENLSLNTIYVANVPEFYTEPLIKDCFSEFG